MSKNVLDEFTGITNEQAYVKIFSKRMMKPIPNRPGEFFGTDQRLDMTPFIQKKIIDFPLNGQIFDVGAGAGDVVDFALKDTPLGTTINIEEPNPNLIRVYQDKIKNYPHLILGTVYEGTFQDYYQDQISTFLLKKPQNLILAIHMIYHLTDFKTQTIDPEADIINAISFLYGLLVPGGSILVIYADLLENSQGIATCGLAEKFFRVAYPQEYFADHLVAIYRARNALLGPNGSIANFLKPLYPTTKPILQSERRETHFFGETIDDIAVLGLATELCPSDNEQFDLAKLKFCLDFVKRYPEQIGLQREEKNIPQKGLWRSNEPQVIANITKALLE